MADMKLDFDKTWLRSTTMWGLIVIASTGAVIYTRMDMAIVTLAEALERESTARSVDHSDIATSVREVRDDLRRLLSENVSARQMSAWLELMRALNKDLKFPDMPK